MSRQGGGGYLMIPKGEGKYQTLMDYEKLVIEAAVDLHRCQQISCDHCDKGYDAADCSCFDLMYEKDKALEHLSKITHLYRFPSARHGDEAKKFIGSLQTT